MLRQLFYNKSINKFNRISFYFATILVFVFILIILYNTYRDYKIDIKAIEVNYISSQKEFIKQETKRALRFIKYKYNKDIKSKKLKVLQDEIVDAIENMRNLNEGSGSGDNDNTQ